MNLSFELLKPNGYVVVNKKLMRILGIDGALLFGELLSEYDYYSDRNQLTDDDYFFSKAENIENNISMSAYRQREALKVLKKFGLVEVDLRGVPAKNYYRLNIPNIQLFLNSDIKNFDNKMSTSDSCEKSLQPDVKNFDNSYKNNNIEKTNNIYIQEVKKEPPKKKKITALEALEGFKEEFNLSDELTETFKDFIEMRKEIKDPITVNGLKRAINTLFKLSADPGEQLEIINQSIIAGYKGLFPLKPYQRQGTYQPQRAPEPEEEDALTRIRKRLEAEEAAKEESGLLSEE